jgi:hypothetical protein
LYRQPTKVEQTTETDQERMDAKIYAIQEKMKARTDAYIEKF